MHKYTYKYTNTYTVLDIKRSYLKFILAPCIPLIRSPGMKHCIFNFISSLNIDSIIIFHANAYNPMSCMTSCIFHLHFTYTKFAKPIELFYLRRIG